MKRSIAVLGALTLLLVGATTAQAGEATTEVPTTETPSTVTDTVVVDTTTETTTTELPATTETPVDTSTETSTDLPMTTEVPTTTDDLSVLTDDGCLADCIPTSEELVCEGANCIPAAAGGGIPTAVGAGAALPFTGIEDAIAPLLLALTVVLGGVVAWRWAQLREAVAAAASRRSARAVDTQVAARTGYASASRQLEIEDRARRVFNQPRVA